MKSHIKKMSKQMRHERKKSDRIKIGNDKLKMQLSDSNSKIDEL